MTDLCASFVSKILAKQCFPFRVKSAYSRVLLTCKVESCNTATLSHTKLRAVSGAEEGILGAFAKLRIAIASFVISVRLSAWNNSAPTRKIFMKLETAQMKFLRHLLVITKVDKENNQCIRGKKTGAQNIVKEIKHYQ